MAPIASTPCSIETTRGEKSCATIACSSATTPERARATKSAIRSPLRRSSHGVKEHTSTAAPSAPRVRVRVRVRVRDRVRVRVRVRVRI